MLPPPGSDESAYRACFERVVQRMLQREFFWVLCNALSMCAFTFVKNSNERTCFVNLRVSQWAHENDVAHRVFALRSTSKALW
jgi:hypothetical protein